MLARALSVMWHPMKFEELGITKNLLWFLIALFLFGWLGEQLLGAISSLEILNLRTTDYVSFDSRPIWFCFVVAVKTAAWSFSLVVMYKYTKSKLNGSST